VLGEEGDERVGFSWSQDLDHITLAEHRVMHVIETAKRRFNIAPSRIFLAGFECGGTMALRLALEHPAQFAGVLSIGGGFPRGHAPLRRLNEVRQLSIMLASGRDSRNYSPEHVCQDLRLFYSAGMAVDLRHYPCGDDLTSQMLSDMDRWIMQQFCSTPAISPVEEASQRRSDEGTGETDETA
jgi:phospholipase/carboxylesterase